MCYYALIFEKRWDVEQVYFKIHGNHGNVHVGYQPSTFVAMVEYATCYQKAGKKLAEELWSSPSYHDYDGCVIVFLYRHALELYLKSLCVICEHWCVLNNLEVNKIKKLFKSHDLIKLVSVLNIINGEIIPLDSHKSISLHELIIFIEELNVIDEKSDVFRYPITTQGQPTRSSKLVFNVGNFVKTADEISVLLENLNYYLKAKVDSNLE